MNKNNEALFRASFDSLYRATSKKGMTRTAAATLRPTLESFSEYANDAESISAGMDNAEAPEFGVAIADADEYAIQRPIRDWFGKPGVNTGEIGAHPDFAWLKATENIEFHHITTVFIDIQNSTRLSLRYDLEKVRDIKNSILKAASETVRALDGHVHRFMGDALMAYFGGKGQDREAACMAAINCAAMLRLLMQEVIVPSLKAKQIQPEDMGFRVGIDYGKDEDVLWSSYGFSDVHEVTATSFFVDAAAKLQSMASKDSAMIGDSLVQYLDFPEVYTEAKTQMNGGEREVVPYLLPNYTLPTGGVNNYRIRELNFDAFIKLMPIPQHLRKLMVNGSPTHPRIHFLAFTREGTEYKPYISMSRCVNKGAKVVFQLRVEAYALNGLKLPLRGEFIRKNYGKEAENARQSADDSGSFRLNPNVLSMPKRQEDIVEEWDRDTSYRGLHTMEVKVFDAHSTLIFADIIGVHIR